METEIRVAIVTSHKRDFAAMLPAVDLLTRCDVQYEVVAISRRQDIADYAELAQGRGIKFILAGTANAPSLPLVLAENSSLPVVGVPLPATFLGGETPPSSLVHMVDNAPLATVAVGDARSAALIALRTLALGDEILRLKLNELGL